MFYILLIIVLVINHAYCHQCHPWEPDGRTKDANWMRKHEQLVNQTLEHKSDERVVFVGDSIIEQWTGKGKPVWDKYYKPRHGYNYGVGGDCTQQVLYRILHKEFDGLNPKVIVLMIGTNNVNNNDTLEDIRHGVQEVIKQLLIKMPTSRMILTGVLPRAEPLGHKCKQLNELIKTLTNGKTVYFLDMWSSYVYPSGQLRTDLYVADKLHLNDKGYQVWQQTMNPLLNKLDPAY